MKILQVGAEFPPGGRTDAQRDMTKLIVALRNFANEPKKETLRRCAPLTGKYSLACTNYCPLTDLEELFVDFTLWRKFFNHTKKYVSILKMREFDNSLTELFITKEVCKPRIK